MLVDVVGEFATEVVRPAAADADDACAAPDAVLKPPGWRSGCRSSASPRRSAASPRSARRWPGPSSPRRWRRATWDSPSPRSPPARSPPRSACGAPTSSSSTYLPAFTGDDVPAAALALTEPTVLFDVLDPATTATRDGDGYVLNGVKSLVPRGAEAELFVVGAQLDGQPVLFLVESVAPTASQVEGDPAMGVRAASLTTLTLDRRRASARTPSSARPTARRTPSACGSRASPGARSRSAPARRCSTT